ncbi:hypothetical protein MJO28_002121 [Puccinia striiformis f. sp. tritici]|uniref:Uncharacterized protein n=1 Tax=Puccinia striiformis f. sp. tritici TaxID=168172 RepID=A0ACC0EW95_9BASI|nr:hypothetical protein Pst134EA_002642 [Puccinia striiformis f. sp. tritici]KAH9472013.1 hypothetical protein Pst134EA_002642 [Puccinia striiformis f. sp. tritici]KAI7961632.1 hypothetical protein MJO28_002121 [Puccinia striiformis f. sp. tritici]
MVVTIVFQIALSCGVVLLYSFIGSCFLNCLGFRRRSEDQAEKEEEEEEEEVAQSDLSNGSELSNDAIHLLRLTNAFCPPKNSPLIFGRDVNNPREDSYYSEDEEDFGEDTFSDVLEESSFCLRDSFEHGHSRRISIKPPAFIHEASVAEIATDHKSTSSARRSSTTFAPEMHHHENEKVNRLFSLITKGGSHTTQDSANRKKSPGFYPNNSCVSEPNGTWGHLTDKKKKLFTVRPSISALRRFNQSKQVHQVDQQKLPSNANRIDYMSSVRTRFKLISSKKLSLKPANKAIGPTGRVDIRRQPDYDGRRMSSVLFGTA